MPAASIGNRCSSASATRSRWIAASLFRSWLREQFSKNEPFDKVVTEMLTAQGDARKVGPANYLAYHLDSTLPITMAHISQTFLGARIGCAQCHDHPFDKWSQQDFWGFAAFLANTRSERRELREDPKDPNRVTKQWHVLTDQNEVPVIRDEHLPVCAPISRHLRAFGGEPGIVLRRLNFDHATRRHQAGQRAIHALLKLIRSEQAAVRYARAAILKIDDMQLTLIDRTGKLGLRLRDPQSELRRGDRVIE